MLLKTTLIAWGLMAAFWPSGAVSEEVSKTVVAKVLRTSASGRNLLRPDTWRPWRKGFQRTNGVFVCDNAADAKTHRGAGQSVVLNQDVPRPIVATVWSRAENVGGTRDADYSLYLDLTYTDGTSLWGRTSTFKTGNHDWRKARVVVMPEKPIRQVHFYMLLRKHSGKAYFREPRLQELRPPRGAAMFDGVPVEIARTGYSGFQVRDVAAGSDFVAFVNGKAMGLVLDIKRRRRNDADCYTARLIDTTGKDRAITLIYSVPVSTKNLVWLADARRSEDVAAQREYVSATATRGGMGRLSRYPLAAVACGNKGQAIALDLARPAVYRVGYNAPAGQLFIAFDLGLTKERPSGEVAFARFEFEAAWGFREALARLYRIWPEYFRCRIPKQGVWMPFAKISEVSGWKDFGFRFKEGVNETVWDDANDVLTFRYTEPMTWWMRMPKSIPRTYNDALAHAKALALKGDKRAQALLTSGLHDEDSRIPCRLLDRPWCNGAVWSVSSAPGVRGRTTDFTNKWSREIREKLYGQERKAKLDGEYVDSSEGYVTAELNFRRDHFAAMTTPLTFDRDSKRPAIFRGLIAFEYIRALEKDVRAAGGLMMANSTPNRLCWLAPWLDVMGTETDWNRGGRWRPMTDADLLFRRSVCASKPFCFLMNTRFEQFGKPLVEKYMKRCLAYGMFPGFFSHNASQGHYFNRPKLYNRDRPLFKKYIPLCKLLAEAAWRPVTLARSSDPKVHVERFGEKYLTVFNNSAAARTATITLVGLKATAARKLIRGGIITFTGGEAKVALEAEDIAVLELELSGPKS